MTTPDITSDPRSLAEERLFHLTRLGMRMQCRGGPDHGGWRDGRGGQGRVLALLARNPEISQRELTFLLGLSRQALAELLAKLEQKGLIERSQSDEDRRVVLVSLTEPGHEAAREIGERMNRRSSLLDPLTDEEAGQFADYLDRIIEPLEAQIAERREERHQRWEDNECGHPRGGGRGHRGHPHGPGCENDADHGHGRGRHHHRRWHRGHDLG